MRFPFRPTWLRGTSPTCSMVCGVSSPILTTPVVPVSPSTRTIPRDSSYGLTLWSRHTTPRYVSRCSPTSNWPCASLRRPGPIHIWLLRSPRRSATAADSRVWLCSIRIYLYRHAFSNTRSPCGLSCHNTNIPWWAFLAGLRRHPDSPCLEKCRMDRLNLNPAKYAFGVTSDQYVARSHSQSGRHCCRHSQSKSYH